MYTLPVILVVALLYPSNGCSPTVPKDQPFVAHIEDILLNSDSSSLLTLKLATTLQHYCRSFDVESDKLSFQQVSCSKKTMELPPFALYYDLDITLTDTASFEALNDTDKASFIEDIGNTELTVTTDTHNDTIVLEDTFIHPALYSYFYSPSMKTLFIFTSNRNDSQHNLITITWNPNANDTDLNDFVFAEQTVDIDINNDIELAGDKWYSYDEDDMFLVRATLEIPIGSCDSSNQWLRYSYIDNIYANHTLFEFDYVGSDYRGIDTRSKTIYGFNRRRVWYAQVDGTDLNEFSIVSFDFDDAELRTTWQFTLYGGIPLFLCFCLCVYGCCRCTKRKRDRVRTMEQHFGADV